MGIFSRKAQSQPQPAAQTSTSVLPRAYKLARAKELYKAWDSAKASMAAFGMTPARKALVSASYDAYAAYLDENFDESEFDSVQAFIMGGV